MSEEVICLQVHILQQNFISTTSCNQADEISTSVTKGREKNQNAEVANWQMDRKSKHDPPKSAKTHH